MSSSASTTPRSTPRGEPGNTAPHESPLPPGRRVHGRAVHRQPRRRRARRRRARRPPRCNASPDVDQPVRDHVRPAADHEEAHYRVRIFTPVLELPFAGHPTLGTCHAWLADQRDRARRDEVVQECAAGLIKVRRTAGRPRLRRSPAGAVRPGRRTGRRPGRDDARSRADRRSRRRSGSTTVPGGWRCCSAAPTRCSPCGPVPETVDIGLVALHPPGSPHAIEVRAFFPKDGMLIEDPGDGEPQRVGRPVAARAVAG